jgi:hypothetical protein
MVFARYGSSIIQPFLGRDKIFGEKGGAGLK